MKRSYIKRKSPLKTKTPLKTRKRLKSKPYKRTEVQIKYNLEHPYDEINGTELAMPTPHHIDERHSNDSEDNFFSLSWNHHVGNESIHNLGAIRFCERFRLTEHPKWKAVYDKHKRKQEYQAEIDRIRKG